MERKESFGRGDVFCTLDLTSPKVEGMLAIFVEAAASSRVKDSKEWLALL